MASKTVTLTPEEIDLLTRWQHAKKHANNWVAAEKGLRDDLISLGLFTTLASKDEGVETIAISNYPGWRIKAGKVRYYNMTNKEGATETALFELEKVNPDVAANIVKWKPTLSESLFKNLPREQQELFTAALTIVPGQGTLELLEPTAAMKAENE